MSRGTKAPFKSFEGKKAKDKHIRITNSMLLNDNYKSLSYSAKSLYNYMKLWACGEREYDYSWSLAKKGVVGSSSTYQSAKDELVRKEFIECVRTGKCSGDPNRYKFIDKWLSK